MDIASFNAFQQQAVNAGVVFFHAGEFTSPIIAAASEALKHRLQETGASGPVTRKLFSTFVEMAQNVHHYGAPAADAATSSPAASGTIAIVNEGGTFTIICVNRIETTQVARLTEKLESVRSMSLEEIKKAYKEQLRNADHGTENPDSKGAGLGWLTIARDSKEPLVYSFMSDALDSSRYAHFLVKAVV